MQSTRAEATAGGIENAASHLATADVTNLTSPVLLFPQRKGQSWKWNILSTYHNLRTTRSIPPWEVTSKWHNPNLTRLPSCLAFFLNQLNSILVARFCTHLLWFMTTYLNRKASWNPLNDVYTIFNIFHDDQTHSGGRKTNDSQMQIKCTAAGWTGPMQLLRRTAAFKIHICLEKFYLLLHKHLKGIKEERKPQHFQSAYFAHFTADHFLHFLLQARWLLSVLQYGRCTEEWCK